MFKFGKSQDSSRIPEIPAVPESDDLQFVLSKAQRNWRTSVELPFRIPGTSIAFSIVVKCEMGSGIPCWTLYRTDATESPILWTHKSNDVLLIHNLISLEYTAAGGNQPPETAPMGSSHNDTPTDETIKTEPLNTNVNPYLAHLQETGKYGSLSDAAPATAQQPPYREPTSTTANENTLQSPASTDFPKQGTNQGSPTQPLDLTDFNAGVQKPEPAPTPSGWLALDKTNGLQSAAPPEAPPVSTMQTAMPEKIAAEIARRSTSEFASLDANQSRLKMSQELKLTRASVEWTLSRSDTGILTYPAFVYFFDNECVRFNRGGLPFSILLFDVKRKTSFGVETIPTEAMKEAGNRLRLVKRQFDVMAHFEDEGFVFILPHTDPSGATNVAARVKQLLTETSLLPDIDPSSLIFSCGLASMPEDGTTPENLLIRARAAKIKQEERADDF